MKTIRIGSGAGFWGDTNSAARQLVSQGSIDYLVFDYLSEVTMSILARARSKDSGLGYAVDFVDSIMRDLLPSIAELGVKVISNAGGINPEACRDALLEVATQLGITIRAALVKGDDLSTRLNELSEVDKNEMFTGAPFPKKLRA